jgi:hypothetical protein
LGIIPQKIGYLGMGIGYNTQKKWVFGYGYWVSCGYHTQYPIPIKKVGTDVWLRYGPSKRVENKNPKKGLFKNCLKILS